MGAVLDYKEVERNGAMLRHALVVWRIPLDMDPIDFVEREYPGESFAREVILGNDEAFVIAGTHVREVKEMAIQVAKELAYEPAESETFLRLEVAKS